MRCPECLTLDIKVLETRQKEGNKITRRRYRCGNDHAFTTLEIYAAEPTARQRAENSMTAVEMMSRSSFLRKRNNAIAEMIKEGRRPSVVAAIAGLSVERTMCIARQFKDAQAI